MTRPKEHPVPESAEEMHESESEDFCTEVEAYIIAKPFKALAIALLAGIVFGRLLL